MTRLPASRWMQGVCLLPLLLLSFAAGAWAQIAQPGIREYSITQWGHREGLLSSTIYAVAQTSDGYLWLGTTDGLTRFDGLTFKKVPLVLKGLVRLGSVRALLPGTENTLWIGTEGGALVRMEHGKMQALPMHAPVLAMLPIGRAAVDVKTTKLVYRVRASDMRVLATCRLQQPSTATSCGAQFEPSVPRALLSAARLAPRQVQATLTDRAGNLWIATREHGVWKANPPRTGAPASLQHFSTAQGLSSDSVLSLFEDRDGNLWASTQRGLDRLRQNKFASATRGSGLLSDTMTGLAGAGHGVYAASSLGLNRVWMSGVTTLLRKPLLAIATGPNGTLFAATPAGVVVLDGGAARRLALGVRALQVVAMTVSPSGELYFFDRQFGLFRWSAGARAQSIAIPADPVAVLQTGSHGELWIGFASGALGLYREGSLRLFDRRDGLPGGAVHSISVDGSDGVWISSEEGLALYAGRNFSSTISSRFSSRFSSWSAADGLPGSRVLWAVRGRDGRLWLGFPDGVASVAIASLMRAQTDRAFAMPIDFYDEADGLGSSPALTGSSPIAVDAEGRIWFTTADGIATLDPAHILRDMAPPLVHIESLTADDRIVSVGTFATLPKHTHRVEITYAGLSLAEPRKVDFLYRLTPFDPNWHQAGRDRFATYTNLPPGQYTFAVQAISVDHRISVQPAVVRFLIPAAFYQTRWFPVTVVTAVLVVVAWAVRRRMRFKSDRVRLVFEERLDERTRFAQDLHDNLLQDVMGISLQLEIADELTPEDAKGKPVLKRALLLAGGVLARGREALTTLRKQPVTERDVKEAVMQVGRRFAEPRRAALHFESTSTNPGWALRAEVAEQWVLLVREAVNNALAHTAGAVHVTLVQQRKRLHLWVSDEGPGMAAGVLLEGAPGHFGLGGMRARAARIPARLSIASNPSAGTVVHLDVAGRVAYAEFGGASGHWVRLLLSTRLLRLKQDKNEE